SPPPRTRTRVAITSPPSRGAATPLRSRRPIRPGRACPGSSPASSRSRRTRVVGAARTQRAAPTTAWPLSDPELVEQDAPLGIELVVPDALRDKRRVYVIRVRHGGGQIHDLPVDGSPCVLALN